SNSDGNSELFLWDARTGFTQITKNLGDLQAFSINADGTRIAFASKADLTGSNSIGITDLYLRGAGKGITQITRTLHPAHSFSPSISADGTRIAFTSRGDLTGTGSNSDSNPEIFLWDERTGITQITNTVSDRNNGAPEISADGTRIAFISDVTGRDEIFLAS